jgi:hypothetical protein
VQVDVSELRENKEEDVGLAHPLGLVLELEEVEDVANVLREALDVADQVLLDVVRVALELLEVERRVVVEAVAAAWFSFRSRASPSSLQPLRFAYSAKTLGLVGARTSPRRTVIGSMTRSYCGGR